MGYIYDEVKFSFQKGTQEIKEKERKISLTRIKAPVNIY